MKLPSFQNLFKQAIKTAIRFPLMLICVIIGVTAMVLIAGRYFEDDIENLLPKIGLFCTLGFTTLIATVIFSESRKWSQTAKLLAQLIVSGLVLIYFFLAPDWNDFKYTQQLTFFLISLATLLTITFVPYIHKNRMVGFWQFNRKTFFRIFLTLLYATTLYGGLSLAMLAVQYLFDVNIKSEYYLQLFFIIFCLFGAWFFAAGIPQEYEELNDDYTYPKVLKFFTQNVLIPLVSLYFIILYAYAIRILIMWQLPQGWVSYLVLALSAIGILAYLFIWPLHKNKENILIKTYIRYFYILLAPLIILLFVAIGRRIADYGITPNRYFILISALWLTGIISYFIFSSKKSIKLIPLSAVIVIVLIAFGPWSVFSVSKNSQMHRLEKMLKENNMLIDGKIIPNSSLKNNTEVEINQILDVLDDINAIQTLEKRWNIQFCSQKDSLCKLDRYAVADALGFKSHNLYAYSSIDENYEPFNFYEEIGMPVDVSGYNYFKENVSIYSSTSSDTAFFYTEANYYKITLSEDKQELHLFVNDSLIFQKNIFEYYNELLAKGIKKSNDSYYEEQVEESLEKRIRPDKKMILECTSSMVDIKFLISQFGGQYKTDSTAIAEQIRTSLLIKEKSPNHHTQ